MNPLYPYFLLIHLFCAIIFLGYLFCDVFLLSQVRKFLGDEFANKMSCVMSKRTRGMPLCFLLLIVTGIAMIHQYIGTESGYFGTTLQQFLLLKSILALGIALMIIVSLVFYYVLKKPSPLRKIIHPLALTLGIIIVILAKFAFYQ